MRKASAFKSLSLSQEEAFLAMSTKPGIGGSSIQGRDESDKIRTIPNDYSHYIRLDKSKQEIRLFRILPQDTYDRITVALYRTSLATRPVYNAVSYTWGDLSDTTQIEVIFQDAECDGTRTKAEESSSIGCSRTGHPFNVTRNLYRALQSLREDQPGYYWIDMLCINQGDTTERSDQVNLMTNIFSGASKVDIWLDPDSQTAEAWLADENAELMVFIAALRDYGFRKPTTISPDSDDQITMLDIWTAFKDFCVTDPHRYRADLMLARDISGHINSTESTFFSTLLQYLPCIERLAAGTHYTPLDSEERKVWLFQKVQTTHSETRVMFLSWLLALYANVEDEHCREAFKIYLKRVTNPCSEVFKMITLMIEEEKVMLYMTHHYLIKDICEGADGPVRPTLEPHPIDGRLDLMFHPWFTRVWVLQEILANTRAHVCVRRQRVNLSMFVSLLQLNLDRKTAATKMAQVFLPGTVQSQLNSMKPKDGQRVPYIWIELASYLEGSDNAKPRLPLFQLIDCFNSMDATDPRDKIFALYHLATDIELNQFRADYSISVAETYTAFTKAVLDATRSLAILHALKSTPGRSIMLPELPSWVPDYQNSMFGTIETRNASRGTKLVQQNTDNAKILSLKGFQIASVFAAIDTRELMLDKGGTGFHVCNIWAILDRAHRELHSFRQPRQTSVYLEDAISNEHLSLQSLAKVLFHGPDELSTLTFAWSVAEGDLERLRCDLPQMFQLVRIMEKTTSLDYERLSMVPGWFQYRKLYGSNTCMILTDCGAIGISPEGTKIGDVIVTFCGSEYPVILRPKRRKVNSWKEFAETLEAGPKYEFIGKCEIEGEMSGETMDQHDWNDLLHAEPTEWLHNRNGCRAIMRGEYRMRFWDVV